MNHTSVALPQVEFINIEESKVSPLISKCQIKVCYVSDEPNRNHSVITKETAKDMAYSLRGAMIVGYYNEAEEDFEEHNRIIEIANGKFKIKDTTQPYGFVDINANVWFQKFLDDNEVEREYLMTEGYLWTGQYPEAQRVIDKGNAQSMELDENFLDASWAKDENGNAKFFIINEAIISKLCILGEDVEPCFEGATITDVQFSLNMGEEFKERFYSLMNEWTDLIKGGTNQMYTRYAVEIGDALWTAVWRYIHKEFPDPIDNWESLYCLEGIYEEGEAKFAILQDKENCNKYYRLDFSLTETEGFAASGPLTEVSKTFVSDGTIQFALEEVEAFAAQYKAELEAEVPAEEEPPVEEESPVQYTLEEIPEYVELQTKYSELENTFNELNAQFAELKSANETLSADLEKLQEFKLAAERKEKENMINSTFCMLEEEDLVEVKENIDKYSLDEIEAKLSVICVRKKVSFNLNTDEEPLPGPTVYNLDNEYEDELVPAWVQAVDSVAKNRK